MRYLYVSVFWLSATLFSFYVVLPAVICLWPAAQRSFVFLSFLHRPWAHRSRPDLYNMSYARNFYLRHDGVTLGVWQVLPAGRRTSVRPFAGADDDAPRWLRVLADVEHPVIVYLHGNAFDRTQLHRRELYERLSDYGYSVLAVDYRGYGDSTGRPTEEGVIADAIAVYEFARRHAGGNRVYIWGHSLGTGVGVAAAERLCDGRGGGQCAGGLILESPFNDLVEAAHHHPLAMMFAWLPWWPWLAARTHANGLYFNSSARIGRIGAGTPVLVMHARDDHVIPYFLAEKLAWAATAAGVDVTFHGFDADRKLGHVWICRAPELRGIVREFLQRCEARAAS